MLTINHLGQMKKYEVGKTPIKVNFEEVSEKELLQLIAVKLFSIRGMLVFYTLLIIISIVLSLVALLNK